MHLSIMNKKREQIGLIPGTRIIIFLLLIFIGVSAHAKTPAKGAAKGAQRFVSIDFNNVDINVFIKFISELSGKNFVIDQRVKGKVTIISPAKISVAEAYHVFESVLEVHGYATVPSGKVIKIIPSPEARSKSIETRLKVQEGPSHDKIVTQLIPLKYASPDDIKRIFTPLVSKSSIVLSYAPTNTLIITDVLSNIKRLMRLIKSIDLPGVGKKITIIPVENAEASKLVSLLGTVFKTRATKPKKGVADRVTTFVADERTNTIILIASEDDAARIKRLVKILDMETPRGQEKIHVYYLENATAEEIVKVLQELPQKDAKATKGKKAAPVVSDKVKITADKATNSLIIMAEKDDYLTLEEIIKKIDIPRAMVYIEALIMEVNVDKNFSLGTQWSAGGETSIGSKDAVIGGSYRTDENIFSIDGTTGTPVLPSGLALGLFGEAINIAGISFPSINAVVNAYKKDKDVHILSTPQIMTMENEKAKIYVGKNIPFQTTATTTNVDTYNSFEYRDVGKTLEITPLISKGRMVQLNISLETTALESTTDFRPTTLKRTVNTTVIIQDGNTIVIGGLIDDSFAVTDYKVPCLGDIPSFGKLFSSTSKENTKTNLFVFLTPRVVQNPREAAGVYRSKKNQIESIKETQIDMYKEGTDTPPSPLIDTYDYEDIPSIEDVIKPPEPEPSQSRSSVDDATNQADHSSNNDTLAAVENDFADKDSAAGSVASSNAPDTAPKENVMADQYAVQVVSVKNKTAAQNQMGHLKALGYSAYVVATDTGESSWHRVRVGNFSNKEKAVKIKQELEQNGITNTLIVKLTK